MLSTFVRLLLYFLVSVCLQAPCHAWQEWKYKIKETKNDDASFTSTHQKTGSTPGGRIGHSMAVYNSTKVIMFGGRDNDVHRPHVPKTYNLVEEDGLLEFETYDTKPVLTNFDPDACQPQQTTCNVVDSTLVGEEIEDDDQTIKKECFYSWKHEILEDMTAEQQERKEEECGFVPAGLYYNDVWMYNLDCDRYGDLSCENDGWRLLHPGVKYGGCRNTAVEHGNDYESRVCDTPSERWGHSAVMFDDETMVIYGGYSHECEDYCSDMWAFDFQSMDWMRIYEDSSSPSSHDDKPGKRWNFSMVQAVDESSNVMFLLFGGHRLWHGFAPDNSQDNGWQSMDVYPEGGYLGDLWIYRKKDGDVPNGNVDEDGETEGSASNEMLWHDWEWKKAKGIEICQDAPGIRWEDRNNVQCTIDWPSARSGHVAAYDPQKGGMWVHGGYTSLYPYPSSNSPGSGLGVKSKLVKEGFKPYSSHSFYLDDLWFYDLHTGYWKRMKPATSQFPSRRTNHIMFHSGNALILHGGYSNNHHFNDTWYYYPDKNKWLEKTTFVHAIYPENCTDDTVQLLEKNHQCIELTFPPMLKRSNQSTYAIKYQEILPFKDQPWRTPDKDHPLYFGIVDDADDYVDALKEKYVNNEVYDEDGNRVWIRSDVPDGTAIAPHAATGPRQYAQMKQISFNSTLTLDIWEWCTSVKGEPTRGEKINGKFGRSSKSIFIPQMRRQSPGWDGCRELKWKHPPSRSGHVGIFVERYNMIFFYGGLGYVGARYDIDSSHPPTPNLQTTYKTMMLNDLWVFNVHDCPRNCSDHGVCSDGFCKCDPGYYGLDCSNSTCPGSVCYYDDDHVQHCSHCCYDGYKHNDEEDVYVSGVRKVACRPKTSADKEGLFTGKSNGICDGFGSCQCAPPFLGEDCSIKDCKNNCSFNGYCSLEFPVSRCICKEGYFGEYCQHIECLNNCSFPNGRCDYTNGLCTCAPISSPYNKTQDWKFWQGEDCSYLPAWCASYQLRVRIWTVFSALFILSYILY